MAVKYRIQYTSVDGVDYTCDISNPSYAGSVIELDGSVEYGLNPVDTLDHPIRSKYLRITVTATTSQDLEDLLTSGERYWRIEFYRGVNKIFFGYLSSEQAAQSFVQDSWDLTLDALDPLAFLEDLAYVDNTGTEYNGDERLGRIVANCLKRGFEATSEEFDILAYIPYDFRTRLTSSTYTEYTAGLFMTSVTIDQDEFIDVDTDEVLSCKEVLERVLGSLNLTITQIDGDKWLIQHFLYDGSGIASKYIEYYDSDWLTTVGTPTSPYSTVNIKTDDISNSVSDVIHINENQQYFFNYALGKKVVDFEYKYKTSLLDNPELDGGTAGVSIPSWDIDTTYAYPNNDGTLRVYRNESSTAFDEAVRSLSTVYVFNGQTLKIQISAEANYDPGGLSNPNLLYQVLLTNTSTGNVYKLAWAIVNGGYSTIWAIDSAHNYIMGFIWPEEDDKPILNSEILFEQELPAITISGTCTLEVAIYEASPSVSPTNTTDYITIHSIDVVPNAQDVSGLSTIAERTDENGYRTDKDSIYLSTGEDTITYNVMRHEFSGTPPITHIKDNLYDASNWRELGYIKAHTALINNKLKKFFTGDFYNFFEPHNIIKVPDLTTNNFRVLEYSFDTKNNVGSVKLEENETTTVAASVSTTNIYANTIKPTIK